MKAFCYEKEIVVFWDPIKLIGDYSIFLNGKEILKTEKTFWRIDGLAPNTEYDVSVSKTHGNKSVLVGESRFKTEIEKQVIDVTKHPYNAVGDGVTLNTLAIQKALDDCDENCKVVIPKGVYLSGGLTTTYFIQACIIFLGQALVVYPLGGILYYSLNSYKQNNPNLPLWK